MFGIGSTELLLILVVALIVLGPKNMPHIARTLGKAMREFRKYSTEFQRTLNTEIAFEEQAEKKKELEKDLERRAAAEKARTAQSSPAEGENPAETVVRTEIVPPAETADSDPARSGEGRA